MPLPVLPSDSRRGLTLRLILAVVLGGSIVLAFAPFSWWPLVILVPLLLIWLVPADLGARRAFLLGWAFGCGYFGFGVYWIYHSVLDFGGAPPVVAGGLTILLAAYLALAPATAIWLWQLLRRWHGEFTIWLLPLIWFSLEWIRGWALTGMPWLSLGYSHIDSPLAGFAPIVGVYGIGALSMLLSVALFRLIRKPGWIPVIVLVSVPATGYGLSSIQWTRPFSAPLQVTMVQGNIPQDLKWRKDLRRSIFDTYWRETSVHLDSDLIVWPEAALPGTSEDIQKEYLDPLDELLHKENTTLLSGLLVSEEEGGRIYNSIAMFGMNNGIYHKRHLVVFGEYFPLRGILDGLRDWISIPYSDLTAGPKEQPLMAIDSVTLGASICFEDAFSREIMLAMPTANILVNISNDAWFGDSLAPDQHLEIARMRAIETGRPMIRANNTGVSAFIDARGRIISTIPKFETASLTEDVYGYQGTTPFYFFSRAQGYIAVFVLAGVIVAVGWTCLRRF